MREAEQSGNFRLNEDGSATLRGVPASIPQQIQSASPLVAAAIKPPELETPKPRSPSPLQQNPPVVQQEKKSPSVVARDETESEEETEEEEEEEEEKEVLTV